MSIRFNKYFLLALDLLLAPSLPTESELNLFDSNTVSNPLMEGVQNAHLQGILFWTLDIVAELTSYLWAIVVYMYIVDTNVSHSN